MSRIYSVPTADFIQKTLNAQLLTGVTAAATLNNVTSIPNLAGVMIIDRVDTNGTETPTKVEIIPYSGTSGSTVVTLTRGQAETTDQDHAVGAIVEFGPDVLWAQSIIDGLSTLVSATTGQPLYTTNVMKPTAPYIAVGSDATGDLYYRGTGGTLTRLPLGTSGYFLSANASLPVWVQGGDVTASSTTTFTNKRIEPRIVTAASYTTDTGTSLDVSTCDQFQITAQAGALKFNNPGGTPVEGQKLIIRIKDDGTSRNLTYDTQFRAIGVTAPTTTTISKTTCIGCIFNLTDTKWDILAVGQEA